MREDFENRRNAMKALQSQHATHKVLTGKLCLSFTDVADVPVGNRSLPTDPDYAQI